VTGQQGRGCGRITVGNLIQQLVGVHVRKRVVVRPSLREELRSAAGFVRRFWLIFCVYVSTILLTSCITRRYISNTLLSKIAKQVGLHRKRLP
jgi:hypothetical protein